MARSDRPLHRSLVKVGTRIFLGGSLAHMQDWFPGLSIVRSVETGRGDVRYRGATVASLLGADALRQRANGLIYIVGSGPSVRDCDVTRLEDGSAILLNGAINLIADPVKTPLAVAIEDERFIWRHFDLVRQKIVADTLCLLSVSVLRAICENDRGFLADKRVVLIDDIRKPYGAKRRSTDELRRLDFVRMSGTGNAGFSLQPDRGVFQGGSVAISALQFALYCEPKLVGLVGIDISNATEPRFYENGSDVAYSGIARAEARMIEHLILGLARASERGIALVNYSAISALRNHGFGYDARLAKSVDEINDRAQPRGRA
jgi:hypothetical protein